MNASIIIEQPEAKLQLLAGADWQPIDSIEKDDIADLMVHRKEEKLPKVAYSSVCQTSMGTYAIGFVHKASGRVKKGKCYALAVVCSSFAQSKRVNDALFVFSAGDKKIVIAVKNGLPFFDSVFESEEEFSASIDSLLPVFDTGCSIYGDDSLLPPPVESLELAQLVSNPHLLEMGIVESMSNTLPVIVGAFVLLAIAVGSFNYYNELQARDAAMKAAREAAIREASKQTAPAETPEQKLEKKRQGFVASHGLCSGKGLLDGYKAVVELLEDYGGFAVNQITADCKTGLIVASLTSREGQPDLFAYKKDPMLKIDVNLKNATLRHEFKSDMIADIDPSHLPLWREFLAKTGTELRALSDIGIGFALSDPVSIYNEKDAADKPVLTGAIAVTGNAAYLFPMINRIVASGDIHWKSFVLNRAISSGTNKKDDFQFQLNGEFYVTP